jgi:hypothetical protein
MARDTKKTFRPQPQPGPHPPTTWRFKDWAII